ncbi:SnoaL-like polyketide cyclase [Pedobacter westerhofensis]|uniref:SnoaL-like polyketide cyclase n=1 Tax=Pedobacter westerhofensis TaxID=425512 RepID=A0A521FL16_9SPHI|nr:ester cyclase [Pedobacter westerhofensis]SMO96903.1 SnoaL-like polyketide cyclase [Pedobacter westerhofensis]
MKSLLKIASLLLLLTIGGSTQAQTATEVAALKRELAKYKAADKLVQEHLKTFDTLDYTVFSNQQWARMHESHGKDIKVFWPDGHITTGLATHIEDMKALFVYAPDCRIKHHPIRMGSGDLTAVSGVFEGTFTKPMPIGNGKFIQPTGKKFNFPMATIGVWKDGVMVEEHLFWDNKAFMDQIGLGK